MIPFLLLVLLPGVLSQCSKGWIHDSTVNKCFLFASNTLHFQDAEAECGYFGGHLASVPNAFVTTFINQNADIAFPNSEFWLGGTLVNGNWTWTDGTPFVYTDWANGQPNEKNNKYTCLSMDNNSHRWYAADCLYLFPYVCEADIQTAPENPSCCDSGWTMYTPEQSCYKVIRWNSWQSAENACKQLNSELVSIHSSGENNFVAELARASVAFNETGQTWIGLFMAPHAVWEWTDDTDLNYSPFLTGHGSGSCAMLISDDLTDIPNARLQWLPADCSLKVRTAVCKYSPSQR